MQRRQVSQRAQAEHTQETVGDLERDGLAGQVQTPGFLDQSFFQQLGYDGRGIHAADLLNKAAGDRLVVGND